MLDIFDRLKGMEGPLEQYRRKAEGYFMFPELEGEIGPRMKFHGREYITWSLNNYLGLANHPEVRKADADEPHLVFGHWAALMGKCPLPKIKALDTGCVWGNQLTLWRWEDNAMFSLNCPVYSSGE